MIFKCAITPASAIFNGDPAYIAASTSASAIVTKYSLGPNIFVPTDTITVAQFVAAFGASSVRVAAIDAG